MINHKHSKRIYKTLTTSSLNRTVIFRRLSRYEESLHLQLAAKDSTLYATRKEGTRHWENVSLAISSGRGSSFCVLQLTAAVFEIYIRCWDIEQLVPFHVKHRHCLSENGAGPKYLSHKHSHLFQILYRRRRMVELRHIAVDNQTLIFGWM